MSRLLFGPVTKSLARGWLVRINSMGCSCKCHGIRTFSSQEGASSYLQKDQQTPRQQIRQPDLLDFSFHQGFFRSSNLLQLGTVVLTTHRNCENTVVGHFPSSSCCDIGPVFSNYIIAKRLHTSVRVYKEESKIEKSVKALKQQVEEEKVKPPAVSEEPVAVAPVKKSLWQRFVAELKHYYHGFRLLFIDTKICTRLLWKVLNGKSLTRRERQQMVRTTADLFRLVPFLVFLLVPFMELLLPVAIKLFPNMLPSTFAEKNKEVEKVKKNLKLKLEMARFLQDTIRETALQKKKKKKGSAAEEFSQFVEKIRSQGFRPTTKEILKFAKLFEDEITLDNLSRQQLQAVCRVLNIQPIGIDALLRFQLDMKLRQLKADDQMIVKEGIDSLSMAELQAANRARGMRALGVSEERLKAQLQQWLTLHLDERIPTSLLLLSRALYLPENLSAEEQLEATISELTQKAPVTTEEVKLKAAELAGEEVDNKTRLEVIKKEESIIAAETQAREMEAKAELEAAQAKAQAQPQAPTPALAEQVAVESKEVLKDEAVVIQPSKKEELVDKAPELKGVAGEELVAPVAPPVVKEEKKEEVKVEDESITVKELEEIESALEEIAQQKRFNIEKEELKDLKEKVDGYKEDLEDLKAIMQQSGKESDALQESKSARRLAKRVDKILHQLDSVMQEVQQDKEKQKEDIQTIEVQMKQSEDLISEEKKVAVAEVMEKISDSRAKIVSLDKMMAAMKDLQKVPDEAKLQSILQVLDEDRDGNIDINLALKVLETLGKQNVKLNKEQLTEMINLLKAEMVLAEEEKKQKEEKKENKEQQNQA